MHAADSISFADVEELISRWWFTYDEGLTDRFGDLFTADVVFTVGVDDPSVAWAEFATADYSGRDAVVAWQTEHRLDSPSPLRHHMSNLHRTGTDGDAVEFASYMLVNHIVDEMPALLPSGVVTGSVRVEDGVLRISRLDVVLDTKTSVALRSLGAVT